MKQTIKKGIAIILTMFMLFTAAPLAGFVGSDLPSTSFSVQAATIVASGECGDNSTWSLDSSGVFTISGFGAMTDYTHYHTPWINYINNIKMVFIANEITHIGDYSFELCESITSVNFGNNSLLTSIGKRAFSSCISLTSITIPSRVQSIGESSFWGCVSLPSTFIIPDSVQSIGDAAFAYCHSLISVIIGENSQLINIGASAFSNCSSLTSINIPDSVTTLGGGAFNNCSNLQIVDLGKNSKITSIQIQTFYAATSLTSITIPDNVTTIEANAFAFCKLPSISIPGKVTSIGYDAFHYCNKMSFVTISKSVETIAEGAFSRCESLSDVYYSGSEEEWNAISIVRRNNEYLLNATIHFNCHLTASDHIFESNKSFPNCTNEGYTTYTCECGESYIADYVDALGHNLSTWTQSKVPTCTEQGEEKRTCSRCSYYETRTVNATGHKDTDNDGFCDNDDCKVNICNHESTTVTGKKNATCTTSGYSGDTVCNKCKATVTKGESIAALGHNLSTWTQSKAPTCTEQGEEKRTCSRCSYYETRTVKDRKSVV